MSFLFRLVWKLLAPGATVLLLVAVAAYYGWYSSGSSPVPLDPQWAKLADEAARKLAESLPVPAEGRPVVTVAPWERDPTGYVTEAVRRAILRVDHYTVEPPSLLENVLRKLEMRREVSPELASSVATGLKSDYLLAGRVEKLSIRTDRDEAVLRAVLVPVHAPQESIPLVAEILHDHTVQPVGLERYSWVVRVVGWLAFALLLPIGFAPWVIRGLEKQSNAVNLAMLLGLTITAAGAAYALSGFRIDTPWTVGLVGAATAAALVYNYIILSKIEDLYIN